MSRNSRNKFLIILLISLMSAQEELDRELRSLKPTPLLNSQTKNAASLKFHSKILQSVYSESYSKNYYYTSLYVGHNKVRQTYLIDTGSSLMASPCSPCPKCGQHKKSFYIDVNRKHKPLKCSSYVCQFTPATSCKKKKFKLIDTETCSFNIQRAIGGGISGYFMRDIVYLETYKKRFYNSPSFDKAVFRSYALPIGCTTEESGKYRELYSDGIMGMSNSDKSFISILYKLKVVNRDIFSLCFGLGGGYMSLGEVDTTYHKSKVIQYVPLLNSKIYYTVELSSLKVETGKNIIKTPILAVVDTGNSISYFPSRIFKQFTKKFFDYCNKESEGKCGNFTYDSEFGYCVPFPTRETLFLVITKYWPNITLSFGDSEYLWTPINYYYYYFSRYDRKACIGFNYHASEKVILGTNFIHGHDIIFDRAKKQLGFVPSDCSRNNTIWKSIRGAFGTRKEDFEMTSPVLLDKELHHFESEEKFHLGDHHQKDDIEFIEGHNTELDRNGFSTINYIILITSIVIVVIIISIVVSVLICGRKKLEYEQRQQIETEYTINEEPNSVVNIPESNE